ncbi:MAG TPA: hypothetical protein VFD19_04200 [Clostridia bacterium]|nr:hypothetical protein [Clostridia bacterium]
MMTLISLTLVVGCAPKPSSPSGNGLPVTTAPAVTENPSPSNGAADIARGLAGSREERLTIGLFDPGKLNLNPFVSGEQLFPVDPSGYFQPIYETLFRVDPAVMDYEMFMAQHMRVYDDRIEIELRHNERWHDGFPIVSADVLFTMKTHEKLGTPTGVLLDLLTTNLSVSDDFSLVIQLNETQLNAGARCLEALAHTLIVPEHIWAPLLSAGRSLEELEGQIIPVVGSGPWSLVYRDEFSFSFKQTETIDSAQETSQYLAVLNYRQPYLTSYGLLNNDVDVLLGTGMLDDILSLEPVLPQKDDVAELKRVMAGERLMGITINPAGHDLLQRKSLRRLLCLSADTEKSSPLLLPSSPAIDLSDVLTIPVLMAKLNRDLLEAELLTRDQSVLDRLIEEADLTLNASTGLLERNEQSIDAFHLTFPEGSEPIEEACAAFVESAGALGVPISLKKVSRDVWVKAYRDGDYQLIYTESSINESTVALTNRLLCIPGVGASLTDLSGGQFDGEEGLRLITNLAQENSILEKISLLEDLSIWVIREGIFVPLAGGDIESGLWNPTQLPSLNFSSFFSLEVRVGAYDMTK